MRLFIAIALPKSVKQELDLVQSELMSKSTSGRFVPRGSYHITLHFIGESEGLLDAVDAMRTSCRGIRRFTLNLDRYGSFEKNGSRTSIVNVRGELDELNALHESLESALYDRGFSRDHKRFTPHITLGRSVVHDEAADAQLKSMTLRSGLSVQEIVLYESRKSANGMIYTPVHTERF